MSAVEIEEARADAALRARVVSHEPLDALIKPLCEAYGYGAVMDSAARQWALIDPMGAFFIGGCLGFRELPCVPFSGKGGK